ncbi:enoyl-CoA hydratase/isomerase family protein [Planomonospora alba]|uniref:Enoyl-CoA hydratase/isomerase family protein n=1 Tax=Planomonospora alba TaxID=161354 RepID=A0ABP6NFC0_9ACTN
MLTVRELLDLLQAPQPLTVDGLPTYPLLVVDLETAAGEADPETLAPHLVTRPQVIIGVLPTDASPRALRLARACTVAVCPQPSRHPQVVAVNDVHAALETLTRTIHTAPVAALSLHQLLHLQEHLPVPEALVAESAVYSTLLAGTEFSSWLARRNTRRPQETTDPVKASIEAGTLRISLSRPARRNAFNAAMREALCDALAVAAGDRALRVELTGHGPDFCAGGDLDEFGTADPAAAHLLRTARSAALALHRLADRTTARLQGNCIGAGIELPAYAGRVLARPDVRIHLPELSMGLIPGAGGTVSLTRRIGRWRTAWLALTGAVLTAREALSWGLIDELWP